MASFAKQPFDTFFTLSGFAFLAFGFLLLSNTNCQAAGLGDFSTFYKQENLKIPEHLEENIDLPSINLRSPGKHFGGKNHQSYWLKELIEHKFNKDIRVIGLEVGSSVYLGQTKLSGQWGVGVVIDKKDYLLGINSRSLSIMKRF